MARRLVLMPVLPRTMVSAALNFVGRLGVGNGRAESPFEPSHAPTPVAAWRINSRRRIGPPRRVWRYGSSLLDVAASLRLSRRKPWGACNFHLIAVAPDTKSPSTSRRQAFPPPEKRLRCRMPPTGRWIVEVQTLGQRGVGLRLGRCRHIVILHIAGWFEASLPRVQIHLEETLCECF